MAAIPASVDPRAQDIAHQLRNTDMTTLDMWSDLDELSTHTCIDAVEVPVEGIVVGPNDRFSAVVNLYVILQYGRDNDEGFSQAESFLAKISGHIEEGEVVVDQSSVDTSSFYL